MPEQLHVHETVQAHLLELPEDLAATWIWPSSMRAPDIAPVTTRVSKLTLLILANTLPYRFSV